MLSSALKYSLILLLPLVLVPLGCSDASLSDGSVNVTVPRRDANEDSDTKMDTPGYPTDYIITPEERKLYTNHFLKSKGVPILEYLPVIEDSSNAKLRPTAEIASRAVILHHILLVAYAKEEKGPEVTKYLKDFNLWQFASPNEKAFLENNSRSQEDKDFMTWRVEAFYTIMWALGHVEKLDFPTKLCSLYGMEGLPPTFEDPTDWIAHSKLRSTESILNEKDLIIRIHWAARNASLKNKPIPAGLNYDAIYERHYVLNWITLHMNQEWDAVSTDT